MRVTLILSNVSKSSKSPQFGDTKSIQHLAPLPVRKSHRLQIAGQQICLSKPHRPLSVGSFSSIFQMFIPRRLREKLMTLASGRSDYVGICFSVPDFPRFPPTNLQTFKYKLPALSFTQCLGWTGDRIFLK